MDNYYTITSLKMAKRPTVLGDKENVAAPRVKTVCYSKNYEYALKALDEYATCQYVIYDTEKVFPYEKLRSPLYSEKSMEQIVTTGGVFVHPETQEKHTLPYVLMYGKDIDDLSSTGEAQTAIIYRVDGPNDLKVIEIFQLNVTTIFVKDAFDIETEMQRLLQGDDIAEQYLQPAVPSDSDDSDCSDSDSDDDDDDDQLNCSNVKIS